MYDPKSEVVKIIDFGLSKRTKIGATGLNSVVGTPYYLAPEILMGAHGKECDCWSLGVIMYVLLSGILPFSGATQAEVFEKLRHGKFSFNFKEF